MKHTQMGFFIATMGTLVLAGCSSKSATPAAAGSTGFTADKPAIIMGAVANGVSAVGGGLSGQASLKSMFSPQNKSAGLSSSDCTVHGEPSATGDHSDKTYAGLLTYCKMTTDTQDEESVQGVFTGIKDIACMVENAAPTYDGKAHDVTLTFDSKCFTADKLAQMNVSSGTTVTASITASAPAAFNTHYDKGIEINVSVVGSHHYEFGTKVTGNIVEVTYFDEDKEHAHKTGSGAGYLDMDKGILRVESRMDRIGCDQSGSCGWNRHFRLYATVTMDGTNVKDPKEVDFIYSNVASKTLNAQGGNDGFLVTASGNLTTTGIKPRGFTATKNSSDADVADIGNWAENSSNGDCFTQTSTQANTCGDGIPQMTDNMKFVMAVDSGYTDPATWFTTENGLSYDTVSANSDTQ